MKFFCIRSDNALKRNAIISNLHELPDVLVDQLFMVSEKTIDLLQLFLPDLWCRYIFLVNQSKGQEHFYYIPNLQCNEAPDFQQVIPFRPSIKKISIFYNDSLLSDGFEVGHYCALRILAILFIFMRICYKLF